jgi:hypothetical protein
MGGEVVSESKFRRGIAEVRTPTGLCHHRLSASRERNVSELDLTTIEVFIIAFLPPLRYCQGESRHLQTVARSSCLLLSIVDPHQVNIMEPTPPINTGTINVGRVKREAAHHTERFANFRLILIRQSLHWSSKTP